MKIAECKITTGPSGFRLWIKLASGHGIYLDVTLIPDLANRSQSNLESVAISGDATTLTWEQPDFHVSLVELIKTAVGAADLERILSSKAASALGRRGGQARTAAKIKASRKNGKKGGRPRTKPNP
jgi:hypothetical protein